MIESSIQERVIFQSRICHQKWAITWNPWFFDISNSQGLANFIGHFVTSTSTDQSSISVVSPLRCRMVPGQVPCPWATPRSTSWWRPRIASTRRSPRPWSRRISTPSKLGISWKSWWIQKWDGHGVIKKIEGLMNLRSKRNDLSWEYVCDLRRLFVLCFFHSVIRFVGTFGCRNAWSVPVSSWLPLSTSSQCQRWSKTPVTRLASSI